MCAADLQRQRVHQRIGLVARIGTYRVAWDTTWNEYRSETARVQCDYYAAQYEPPPHPCSGDQAFRAVGAISPNNGAELLGHAVFVPHYPSSAASLLLAETTRGWELLEEQGSYTPFNSVETVMFADEPACEEAVWNSMKGSWNLSPQTLGCVRLMLGEVNPLHDASWHNGFLGAGYESMAMRHCHANLPVVYYLD